MTNAALLDYYAGLLVIQYIGKPNAWSTAQALARLALMDQLPLLIQNAFNTDGTAMGVQLDIIGKYAGVTRSGNGVFGEPITLSDADFLKLIRLSIITNNSKCDLQTIQSLLQIYFANEIFVFDHEDMRMSYLINTSIGSEELLEIFVTEGLLPKPMGVALAPPIAVPNLKFFGFLDAQDVSAYDAQNGTTVTNGSNAVATANNISPFDDASAHISGQWIDANQGVL